ncbi:MAG TPA: hypothetical protein VGO21_00665 [Candidatus Paceibacterota bacterium]|jgi:hypothetical protein|nr:hypothetical protein [Candidatus Paceibacterota bacterium]
MAGKIKNIIIFLVIGTVFVLIYIFFIKGSSNSNTSTLVSSTPSGATGSPTIGNNAATPSNSLVAQDFLNLLLSVKSIKLNDTLFADPAFTSLHDSSITLIPDTTEGRPNPFAPIGTDVIPTSANSPATSGTTPPPATPAPVKK